MTSDETNDGTSQRSSDPHPALKALDRLVGTWTIFGPGGLGGTVTYEWMEGGHFLVQRVELIQDRERTTGVEVIGHNRERGVLASHYFGSSGDLFEYVYELDGDTLTIWHPEVGSPAYFRGEFSADGKSNAGRWVWPGGGYESNMIRTDR